MKKLFALLFLLVGIQTIAFASAPNYGFEDGDYDEWVVTNGSTTVRTTWSPNGSGVQVTTGVQNYCPGGGLCWTITPYGSYMVAIQPGAGSPTFNNAMAALGLSAADINTIRNTIFANGSKHPTNASTISRTVYLQAGMTYSFAWQYLSTDYTPWNDGSMITLTNGPGVPTLNGQTQNFALLGFTNPGTGNYSVGSYGATGWQVAVFTVPLDGNYTLGFSAFNLGDTALSPILFIDQLQGTTLRNGTEFTPVPPNAGSSAPSAPPPPPPEPVFPVATISTAQTIKMTQTNAVLQNKIYIESYGDSNVVTIEQFSNQNEIRGVNGAQAMLINGSNNTVTIHQGTPTTPIGKNLAEIAITGNGNILILTQRHNGKYAEIVANGTGNSISAEQKDAGAKALFFNVLGNNSSITALQQGSGNHFLEINAPFGSLNANIQQSGSANKQFQLIINNPGIGVTVQQTSSTTADSARMEITCTTGPCTGYSYVKGN